MHRADLPLLDDVIRPRWRPGVPVLWRTRTSIQFGDDVIVDRVTAEHVSWLAGLDGARTGAQVAAELPIDAADAHRLLVALSAAGGLVDAARMPDVARAATAEREAIMRDFDIALDTYRELPTAFAAVANRSRTRIAITGASQVAEAVASAARDTRLAVVPDPANADVVVLASTDHAELPIDLDDEHAGRAHLHVGVRGARAVVGPLVVAGRTGCVRCTHLHRRDADPSWPMLSVQLASAAAALPNPATDPLLARVAASHALLLVRAWIDAPDDPTEWADIAIELRLPGPTATRVGRPPHPLCGCRWQLDSGEGAQ